MEIKCEDKTRNVIPSSDWRWRGARVRQTVHSSWEIKYLQLRFLFSNDNRCKLFIIILGAPYVMPWPGPGPQHGIRGDRGKCSAPHIHCSLSRDRQNSSQQYSKVCEYSSLCSRACLRCHGVMSLTPSVNIATPTQTINCVPNSTLFARFSHTTICIMRLSFAKED